MIRRVLGTREFKRIFRLPHLPEGHQVLPEPVFQFPTSDEAPRAQHRRKEAPRGQVPPEKEAAEKAKEIKKAPEGEE